MRIVGPSLQYLVLIMGAIVLLVPLVWTISTSLKTMDQLALWPPPLLPQPVAWDNYIHVFQAVPLGQYFLNTMIIEVCVEIGALVTCSFVAYGFARTTFPGRDVLFMLVLSTMMMPFVVRLIPLFVIYRQIHWLNTFLPLTVPSLMGVNGFNIFLLRQFFKGLPTELSDAARIDGCSDFGIWWRIVMPLSKPALAAVAIFTFQSAWDDFLGPLVFLGGNPNLFTLTVGLYSFRSMPHEGLPTTQYLMAMAVLMTIPVLAIFAVGQRYFIQGVTLSGLKG
jgi:ABC-type glycerol-3-phosphate transport system permease component